MPQQFCFWVLIRREQNTSWKDTCTPMFTAVLFTAAELWKQHKCPSTDDRVKQLWFVYTMEYYSAMKGTQSYHLQQHGHYAESANTLNVHPHCNPQTACHPSPGRPRALPACTGPHQGCGHCFPTFTASRWPGRTMLSLLLYTQRHDPS